MSIIPSSSTTKPSDNTSDDSPPNKRQKKEPNGERNEDNEEEKANQSRDDNKDKEKDENSDEDKDNDIDKDEDKDEDKEEDSDESKDGESGEDSEEESDDESSEPELSLNKSVVQKLLSQFECPVCMIHVTPPIPQCHNGHIICRECHQKLSTKTCPTCRTRMPTVDTHNLVMEQMAVDIGLRFPCKFKASECQMNLLMSDKASHEKCCQYEPYLCPSLNGPCNWSGNGEQLIQHLTDTHKWITLNGNSFCSKLKSETMNSYESYKNGTILHYKDHYFIWCKTKKYMISDDRIFTFFVVFVGHQNEANKYKYKCEIVNKSNGSRLTFEGKPNSIRDKSSFTNSECLVFTSNTAKRYLNNGILTINSFLMDA